MAAGATSRTAAGEAEKLHRMAEERFLVGDVAGSLRFARKAEARCRSPEGSQALAAYEVDAVLGVGSRGGVTHENMKRHYRRLCLVLHPDKNRSAAAEGAFKLLQEAWAVLSARHPPLPAAEAEPCSAPAQPPRAPSTTAGASAEKSTNHSRQPERGASPPRPRPLRMVYCGQCDLEFYAQEEEKQCVMCGEQLRESRRPAAGGKEEKEKEAWRENGSYSYPGQCPRCGARDVYKPFVASELTWQLRCLCCHHQGPLTTRKDLSSPNHS